MVKGKGDREDRKGGGSRGYDRDWDSRFRAVRCSKRIQKVRRLLLGPLDVPNQLQLKTHIPFDQCSNAIWPVWAPMPFDQWRTWAGCIWLWPFLNPQKWAPKNGLQQNCHRGDRRSDRRDESGGLSSRRPPPAPPAPVRYGKRAYPERPEREMPRSAGWEMDQNYPKLDIFDGIVWVETTIQR